MKTKALKIEEARRLLDAVLSAMPAGEYTRRDFIAALQRSVEAERICILDNGFIVSEQSVVRAWMRDRIHDGSLAEATIGGAYRGLRAVKRDQ